MLSISISLSAKAEEKTNEAQTPYKKGEPVKEDVWCYTATNLKTLRVGLEKCDADKIELKHFKELNEKLVASQTEHNAIWQSWWVKLPVGLAVGALSGYLVGQSTNSPALAGLVGGVTGTGAALLLDVNF